jgi:hypothetical protein
MAVDERIKQVPSFVEDLVAARRPTPGLVLFPDELSEVGGESVAGFRPDAQVLRVIAIDNDIPVDLAIPAGSRAGIYVEHDADWVLPLVLSVPSQVAAALIVAYLERRLEGWREGHETRTPTVRYREVIVESEASVTKVREIEGSAPEVIEWLTTRRTDVPTDAASTDALSSQ